MRILLIDNFDSFTYNLVHYLEKCNAQVYVVRNDRLSQLDLKLYDGIIISPGPGLPNEANEMMNTLAKTIELEIPLFGVCLGFQAIGEYFRGKLYNQEKVKHGVQESASRTTVESKLLMGLPPVFNVGLYHSWALELKPDSELHVTARSIENVIMAYESTERKIYGVQFHPESILTDFGQEIIQNFIEICRK